MSEGKSIAQSGHAYIGTLKCAFSLAPRIFREYLSNDVATKISLNGGSEEDLIRLHDELQKINIPSFLVYDHGHIELPDFDGSRKLTCLGIGPIAKSDAPKCIRKLSLWKPKRRGPT